jgi:ribosomal protein S18 acetylase RimI-like enzyme
VSGTVSIVLEEVARDAPEVASLYAAFIPEVDGPLASGGEDSGVDLEAEIAAGPPADLAPPNGLLLLARVDGTPAGIGGLRYLDTEAAEIKSMYVSRTQRGVGLGRRILDELHRLAAARGCRATILDSSSYLTEAIALYRSAGYTEVPPYNENPRADVWFERQLNA